MNLNLLAQEGDTPTIEDIGFFSESSLVLISKKLERQTLVQRYKKRGAK